MQREKIGIKGVDSMIEGGIPSGAIIGLSGPPGVGKSIFNLQFVLEGARAGQKCVYISLEEPRSNIDRMINQFSFAKEFLRLEKKGKIIIKCFTYPEYEKLYNEFYSKLEQDTEIKRLVIDSFNCFFTATSSLESINDGNEFNTRKMINQALSIIRKKGMTTILILETQEYSKNSFLYNIPYLVDGIIHLDFLQLGTIERRIFVPKMRWTNQFKESKAYEIDNKGILLKEED